MEGHNSACGPHRCEICGRVVSCTSLARHVEPCAGRSFPDLSLPLKSEVCGPCSREVGYLLDESLRSVTNAGFVTGNETQVCVTQAIGLALEKCRRKTTDHQRQSNFEESSLFLEYCLAHPDRVRDEEKYIPALRHEVLWLRRELQAIWDKAGKAAPLGVRVVERE